jgi:hypothetical protein
MRELDRDQLIIGKRILRQAYGLVRDGKDHLAGHECSARLSHIADEILVEFDQLDSLLERQKPASLTARLEQVTLQDAAPLGRIKP